MLWSLWLKLLPILYIFQKELFFKFWWWWWWWIRIIIIYSELLKSTMRRWESAIIVLIVVFVFYCVDSLKKKFLLIPEIHKQQLQYVCIHNVVRNYWCGFKNGNGQHRILMIESQEKDNFLKSSGQIRQNKMMKANVVRQIKWINVYGRGD